MGDSIKFKTAKLIGKALGYQILDPSVAVRVGEANIPQSYLTRLFGKWLGVTYTFGDWKAEEYITKGYMGNPMVYSVVDRITNTCAIPPFKVYKIKDKRKHARYAAYTSKNATPASLLKAMTMKQEVYEEVMGTELNDLIDKPNKLMSANEFTQASVGFKLLTGNRYWFVNKLEAGANAGKPYELYNLPPQHTTPQMGANLWDVAGYIMQLNTEVKLPKDVIIHSRYWNPNYDGTGSHLIGLSPLKAASKILDRSNLAQTRGASMMKNAGAEGILYNESASEDDMTTEQVGQMQKKLNDQILGAENAGAIRLANGKLGFIRFGMSASDMGILEQEKYSNEMICNVFKVPAGLFLANANATDNNISAWNKQLITQACIPALCDLRDDWNEVAKMYKGQDLYVDFDLSFYPELQEDMGKQVGYLKDAWWISGEQKRNMMNMDDDPSEPMLKAYLVPSSLQPISNINPDRLIDEVDRTINDIGENDLSDQGE